MKFFKDKNRGITLVALVVTVIILLILAGITISQLTGSGLFENAKLAEQKSKEAQEKEEGILSEYENEIGEYVDGSRDTVTISREEYESMKAKLDNFFDYSNHEEKVIGTWYDGKTLYELSIPITMPTCSTNGTIAETNIDLSSYNMDTCIVGDGYLKIESVMQTIPISFWASFSGYQSKIYYNHGSKKLVFGTTNKDVSGATGYVTLHYTKTE